MHEFRPAAAIADDTALAEALRAGDLDAVAALVDRYGAPVTRVARDEVGEHADDVARDVFLQAWRNRDNFEPGRDFGPWMLGLVARAADVQVTDELETRWAITAATTSFGADHRDALRAFYVDGVVPDDDAAESAVARDRLRLDRRIEHLGGAAQTITEPSAWPEVDPNLVDRVRDAVASESEMGVPDERDIVELAEPRSSRVLRPVLIGLVAAMAVLLIAIVGLSASSGTPEPEDFTVDLVPTGLLVDAEGGSITVTERDAGIEIEVDAPTLPRRGGGDFYRGVLVLDDGAEITVGSFSEGVGVSLWGGVDLSTARTFWIVLDDVDDLIDDDDVVLKANFPRS